MTSIIKYSGLYKRGQRNALDIKVVDHKVELVGLPKAFVGYKILHLTDLHADNDPAAMNATAEIVKNLSYDLCVLTGDFRSKTHGDFQPALNAMTPILSAVTSPMWGVLGNHDSIKMVEGLANLGVDILLNESTELTVNDETLYLAGVDDSHYFDAADVSAAAKKVPADEPAILLSHTPEPYAEAADAGFDLMLCGHTHGGQICLPGGTAVTYNLSLIHI